MNIAEQVTRLKTDFDEVYEAGYSAGESAAGNTKEAYAQGVADGKQAEWSDFWDAFQNNGNRDSYSNAFYMWRDGAYRPKYALNCTNGGTSAFNYSHIADTIVPIDISGLTDTTAMFRRNANLETIRSLIVSESTVFAANTFQGATCLVNITIVGVIGQNGLDLKDSTLLSKVSIISIVNALSTTTSGLSITLSKTAVESAFSSTTADEWTALIATKSNWTITLV